ncbi:MAG TPA: DinB family protein [Chitinophagaceae bacterium]|nr:DinB family protein [Chitinophagaceae bacterium]
MKSQLHVLKGLMLLYIIIVALPCISSGETNPKKDKPHKKYISSTKKPGTAPPFAIVIQRQLDYIESHIVALAEAMPADKFDFTPESLDIKGSDFKGVRSFAGQIKHLATDNFAIWSPVTGDPLRADITDVNGPGSIKTKEDILKYLKDSFAQGHKAIATLTEKNATELLDFRGSKYARLDLAFYALTHSNEHFGQMVVYLRMCGIVPPSSMATQK